MAGIFGGILGFVNLIGGLILSILMGFSIGFRETGAGRWWRVLFGGVVVGAALGTLIGLIISFVDYEALFPNLHQTTDPAVVIPTSIFFGTLGVLATVIILEAIKNSIEG